MAYKLKVGPRNTARVKNEYSQTWQSWRQSLKNTKTIREYYLTNKLDKPRLYIKRGKPTYGICDDTFYVKILRKTIIKEFKKAKRIIEFGSGSGRNLIYLKKLNPNWKMKGYELTKEGVSISKAASKKFKVKVLFKVQNILKKVKDKKADIGFTSFALEQINLPVKEAEKVILHLLCQVRMGLVLLEPISDFYPKSLRGYFAKRFHEKTGYCSTFGKALINLQKNHKLKFKSRLINKCHNPLLFPSLVVIKK